MYLFDEMKEQGFISYYVCPEIKLWRRLFDRY